MSNVTLLIGQSVAVTTYIVDGYNFPAPSSSISWITSNPAIAVVDNVSFVPGTDNTVSTTTIHGISNGTAVVTAVVNGTVSNTIDVTVNSPSPSVLEFVIGTPTP